MPKIPENLTPAKIDQLTTDFLAERKEAGRPPMIYTLAMYLGFDSGQSFQAAWQGEGELSRALKNARERVVTWWGEELQIRQRNPAGLIFWLKNHGWSDRQELQLTVNVKDWASTLEAIKGQDDIDATGSPDK